MEAKGLKVVQYFGCRLLLNHNEEREEETYMCDVGLKQAVKDAFSIYGANLGILAIIYLG